MALPRIAVTMGDPAGIGPEICLRMLAEPSVIDRCVPVIFGDVGVLKRVAQTVGLPLEAVAHTSPTFGGDSAQLPYRTIRADEWSSAWISVNEPAIFDLRAIDADAVQPGTVDQASGLASYRYIEAAIAAALAGEVDAVCTGPINKAALNAAGVHYAGHTEIFTARTAADRACMMLTCDELTCSFVTTHVGYRDVPGLLNVERVREVIELSHDAMMRLRGWPPSLIVCGLNPHAGENGLFGNQEEERIILPAIKAARQQGINVEGPLPPDTAFLPARRRDTDCFVCMYHDQGHIPLKALAFDVAVNITLGLPIIRTSVDHGTALDIAWQGKAKMTSLIEAMSLAARLAS